MKHVIIILLSLFVVSAHAQISRRDSLLEMGRSLRDAKMYPDAILQFTEAGGDAGRLEIATTRYSMGEFRKAIAICKELVSHESIFADQAQLLIARIREAQGFARIARIGYKRLIRKGNADAPYYFALMMHKTGHNNEAVALLQQAIQRNKANIDAHVTLSELLLNGGQRYLAMMPIMYTLLYSTDTATIREVGSQLESLWSNSSHIILKLTSNRKNYVGDNVPTAEAHITDWIRNSQCEPTVSKTQCITPLLLDYLKNHQEISLDWWQITYADFYISICEAGFQDAFIHHICASVTPDATRSWIESHEGNYAEFLTWLTLQR